MLTQCFMQGPTSRAWCYVPGRLGTSGWSFTSILAVLNWKSRVLTWPFFWSLENRYSSWMTLDALKIQLSLFIKMVFFFGKKNHSRIFMTTPNWRGVRSSYWVTWRVWTNDTWKKTFFWNFIFFLRFWVPKSYLRNWKSPKLESKWLQNDFQLFRTVRNQSGASSVLCCP